MKKEKVQLANQEKNIRKNDGGTKKPRLRKKN